MIKSYLPILNSKDYKVLNNEDVFPLVESHISKIGLHPTQDNWNDYWGEHSENSDRPNYLKERKIYRWRGQYIEGDQNIEHNFFSSLKTYLFKYINPLTKVNSILEVGCGIGTNLIQYKSLYPYVETIGCDWSANAVEICKKSPYIDDAFQFNMITDKKLPKADVILTCGSLEQLGGNTDNIYNIFSSLKNCIFVHIEPIIEMYGKYGKFDDIAKEYHLKRDYLQNFYSRIKKPIFTLRTEFGNMYNEGYMVLIWTP